MSSKARKYFDTMLNSVPESSVPSHITEKAFAEAWRVKEAMKKINSGEMSAAQARLFALWDMYQYPEFYGEYDSLDDVLSGEIYLSDNLDNDKVRRAANVIKGIVAWCEEARPKLADGSFVSAERLLDTDGMECKLRNVNSFFMDVEEKYAMELLQELFDGTQSSLARLMKDIKERIGKSDGAGDEDGDEEGETLEDSYHKLLTVKKIELPGVKVRYIMDGTITAEQAAVFEATVQDVIDFEMTPVDQAQ